MGLTCACFLSVGSCTSHTIGGLSDVDFVRYIWHSLHYIYSTFIITIVLFVPSGGLKQSPRTYNQYCYLPITGNVPHTSCGFYLLYYKCNLLR